MNALSLMFLTNMIAVQQPSIEFNPPKGMGIQINDVEVPPVYILMRASYTVALRGVKDLNGISIIATSRSSNEPTYIKTSVAFQVNSFQNERAVLQFELPSPAWRMWEVNFQKGGTEIGTMTFFGAGVPKVERAPSLSGVLARAIGSASSELDFASSITRFLATSRTFHYLGLGTVLDNDRADTLKYGLLESKRLPFGGECQDSSVILAFNLRAFGIDAKLLQISATSGKFSTSPVLPAGVDPFTSGSTRFRFGYHQVVIVDGLVFDPNFQYEVAPNTYRPAIGIPESEFLHSGRYLILDPGATFKTHITDLKISY